MAKSITEFSYKLLLDASNLVGEAKLTGAEMHSVRERIKEVNQPTKELSQSLVDNARAFSEGKKSYREFADEAKRLEALTPAVKQREHNEAMKQGQEVTNQYKTHLQKYNEEVDHLNHLLHTGAISQQTYGAAMRHSRIEAVESIPVIGQMVEALREIPGVGKLVEGMITSGPLKGLAIGGGILAAGAGIKAAEHMHESVKEAVVELSAVRGDAKLIGAGVEELEGLQVVAHSKRVEADELKSGLMFMQRFMGGEGAKGAMLGLGLDFAELKKQSPVQQIREITDAIGKLTDAGERMRTVRAIFGRGGQNMLKLGGVSEHEYEDLVEEGKKRGVIQEEDTIEKIYKSTGASRELKEVWEGIARSAAPAWSQATKEINEELTKLLEQKEGKAAVVAMYDGILEGAKVSAGAVKGLTEIFGSLRMEIENTNKETGTTFMERWLPFLNSLASKGDSASHEKQLKNSWAPALQSLLGNVTPGDTPDAMLDASKKTAFPFIQSILDMTWNRAEIEQAKLEQQSREFTKRFNVGPEEPKEKTADEKVKEIFNPEQGEATAAEDEEGRGVLAVGRKIVAMQKRAAEAANQLKIKQAELNGEDTVAVKLAELKAQALETGNQLIKEEFEKLEQSEAANKAKTDAIKEDEKAKKELAKEAAKDLQLEDQWYTQQVHATEAIKQRTEALKLEIEFEKEHGGELGRSARELAILKQLQTAQTDEAKAELLAQLELAKQRDRQEEVAKLRQKDRTPEQVYKDSLAKLDKYRAEIGEDAYNEGLKKARKAWTGSEKLKTPDEELKEQTDNLAAQLKNHVITWQEYGRLKAEAIRKWDEAGMHKGGVEAMKAGSMEFALFQEGQRNEQKFRQDKAAAENEGRAAMGLPPKEKPEEGAEQLPREQVMADRRAAFEQSQEAKRAAFRGRQRPKPMRIEPDDYEMPAEKRDGEDAARIALGGSMPDLDHNPELQPDNDAMLGDMAGAAGKRADNAAMVGWLAQMAGSMAKVADNPVVVESF